MKSVGDGRPSPRTVLVVRRSPIGVGAGSAGDTSILVLEHHHAKVSFRRTIRMTDMSQSTPEEEPIGIVISRGSRKEAAPRFAAYVWSQLPEPAALAVETKAA
jgi:hypothetical protein